MAERTLIEWADHTFNPWEGCQHAGPGCDGCYAETRDKRFNGGTAPNWGPGAPRRRTSPANWRKPLAWQRDAVATGTRPRVFCASLADVFDNAVDPQWRLDLAALILATPDLDWLLLTKRIGNIAAMLPADWGTGWRNVWRNVWLGCTVVNQVEADRDIPKLLAVPAVVQFLSMEPLLGPVGDVGLATGEPGTTASRLGDRRRRAWPRRATDAPRLAPARCAISACRQAWHTFSSSGASMPPTKSARKTPGRSSSRPAMWFLTALARTASGRRLEGQTWDQMPEVRP